MRRDGVVPRGRQARVERAEAELFVTAVELVDEAAQGQLTLAARPKVIIQRGSRFWRQGFPVGRSVPAQHHPVVREGLALPMPSTCRCRPRERRSRGRPCCTRKGTGATCEDRWRPTMRSPASTPSSCCGTRSSSWWTPPQRTAPKFERQAAPSAPISAPPRAFTSVVPERPSTSATIFLEIVVWAWSRAAAATALDPRAQVKPRLTDAGCASQIA